MTVVQVGGFSSSEYNAVFILDRSGVRFAVLADANERDYWVGYFVSSRSWPDHLKFDSPLESLFRGAYTRTRVSSGLASFESIVAEMQERGTVAEGFVRTESFYRLT